MKPAQSVRKASHRRSGPSDRSKRGAGLSRHRGRVTARQQAALEEMLLTGRVTNRWYNDKASQ